MNALNALNALNAYRRKQLNLLQELVWHFLSVESVHANVQNNNGTTPLHISATSGDVSISSMLLSYGAQPNAKALDGTR